MCRSGAPSGHTCWAGQSLLVAVGWCSASPLLAVEVEGIPAHPGPEAIGAWTFWAAVIRRASAQRRSRSASEYLGTSVSFSSPQTLSASSALGTGTGRPLLPR